MFFRTLHPLWLLVACLAPLPLLAEEEELVRVEVIAEVAEVRAGESFRAGVQIDIADGWHIYGEDPGISGLPTTVEWELPEGVTAGPLQYPPTTTFTFQGEEGDGYEDSVVLWSVLETEDDLDGPVTIHATVSWLVCRELCMPGDEEVSLTVPVAASTRFAEENREIFGDLEQVPPSAGATRGDGGLDGGDGPALYTFLLFGLLGGLILNLMPCVFPVLGIKIMGFVNQAGEARGKVIGHGLVFSAGVLVSFWILAGVLIALRAGGQELGWGFQLQEPGFVLALTVVLLVFGLNMSGVFEFGLSAVGVGSGLTSRGGMTGSFFSGVLATVVATPCAAPFLAPALGAALALPPVESIAVFTAIAVGLALPYLTLSAFPALVKMLPRPGAWMESFKQFMSFLLYGTVAYLLWVLAGQVDAELFLVVLFGFVAIAMGCWVYGRWGMPHKKPGARWSARIVALLLLVVPFGYTWSGMVEQERRQEQAASGDSDLDFLVWEAWTPEKEAALREEGNRFVYIDFTARWCATCQVNKRAYEDPDVIRAFLENDVALLKADWTNKDPAITRALAEFDRSAIPFNLIYAPGEEDPVILPELFGPGTVLEKLEEAGATL